MVVKMWRNTGAEDSLALLFQAATAVLRAVGVLELNFRIVLDHFDALEYCQEGDYKFRPVAPSR